MKIKVREMTEPVGGFFEVYVSTPLEVCEQRDPPLQRGDKGDFVGAMVPVAMPLIPTPLSKRGVRGDLTCTGVIKEFTGVSGPYEAPEKPESGENPFFRLRACGGVAADGVKERVFPGWAAVVL